MSAGPFDPVRLLETLAEDDVEFIVIGQIAAVPRGHPETTVDLDILPKHALVNAERLADALRSLNGRHVSNDPDAEPMAADKHELRRIASASRRPKDIRRLSEPSSLS